MPNPGVGLNVANDTSGEVKKRVATFGSTAIAGREDMTRLLIAVAASMLAGSFALAQSANQAVVRLDPALDALVSPDAKVELVKGGFGFTEGPVWVQKGKEGYLLFTDIPGAVVWKLTADGKASVYLDNVGYNGPDRWRWGPVSNNSKDRNDPNFEEFVMMGADGLTVDRQGRLILATFAGRSLMRIETNGKRTVLADSYEGKRFGGPNDVVVKRDGAIYFTDTYGALRLRDKDPKKELDFNAVYRWKDGKLTLMTKDMPNTNGLAFSPDEKYLYVNGSRDSYVNRYEVQARSEEHTSELQSRSDLVCRLLLEKKKNTALPAPTFHRHMAISGLR